MQRRLAAILAADMVGYSRLMAADEAGTVARQKAHRRDIVDPAIAAHGGRLFKTTGDGFLAEFASAVEAVECAVAIQRAIAEAEAAASDEERIVYRMGINLGDVLVDEDDLVGDGVNVAARIEQLAEPGAVFMSDVVHRNVRSRVDLSMERVGTRTLKNIPGEIELFRVATARDGRLNAISERPLPSGKLSIVVMPFANMTKDEAHDFFADGMTEDIITALSRIGELFVLSRNTSFVYKDKAVRLEDVAKELGVRYLLEGSVRVAGGRVRVTAQLIDGGSGGHLWAERFDGDLEDIFSFQDEITRCIALAMQVRITYGDLARIWDGQTSNLRAWEKMAQGRALFLRFNTIDNREAIRLFEEALQLDPAYTGAIVQLGLCHWIEARFNRAADKEERLGLAERHAGAALTIDPAMGAAFMLKGGVAFLRDRHAEAVSLCTKAVALAPSDSWATAFLGLVQVYAGDAAGSEASCRMAVRLSPHAPSWYFDYAAWSALWLGDLDAALEAARRAVEVPDPVTYALLVTVHAFRGEHEAAEEVMRTLRAFAPDYTLRDVILSERYAEPDKLERVLATLRLAGLPS